MQCEWIFGYGSIIWRADFPYEEAHEATIGGFKRRFWQASSDHRGTPNRPGRVVTLVPSTDDICVGRAYRISEQHRSQVFSDLDHREKNGYIQKRVSISLADGRRVTGVTYYADANNPHYLGDAPVAVMAQQIMHAHGPSGSNLDYLQQLHEALPDDDHVADLIKEIHRISSQQG